MTSKHHERLREQFRRKTLGYKPDMGVLPDAVQENAKPSELNSNADLAEFKRDYDKLRVSLSSLEDKYKKGATFEELTKLHKTIEDLEADGVHLRASLVEAAETLDSMGDADSDATEVRIAELEAEVSRLTGNFEETERALIESQTILAESDSSGQPEPPFYVDVSGKTYLGVPMWTGDEYVVAYITAGEWKSIIKRSAGVTAEDTVGERRSGKKLDDSLTELVEAQVSFNGDDEEPDEDDSDD